MNFATGTRHLGGVTILDINGRIAFGEEIDHLRNLVCELLGKGHRKILFNLGGVDYIDTSGVGFLVGAFTSVRRQGGELKLLSLRKHLKDVMQTMNLYTVFDITDDEATGIESFGYSATA